MNKTTGEKTGRYLVIMPKEIEISTLKILKEEEEQLLEQMLAQNLANV